MLSVTTTIQALCVPLSLRKDSVATQGSKFRAQSNLRCIIFQSIAGACRTPTKNSGSVFCCILLSSGLVKYTLFAFVFIRIPSAHLVTFLISLHFPHCFPVRRSACGCHARRVVARNSQPGSGQISKLFDSEHSSTLVCALDKHYTPKINSLYMRLISLSSGVQCQLLDFLSHDSYA